MEKKYKIVGVKGPYYLTKMGALLLCERVLPFGGILRPYKKGFEVITNSGRPLFVMSETEIKVIS